MSDAVLAQEIAQEAQVLWLGGSYDASLQTLQRLDETALSSKDPKVMHAPASRGLAPHGRAPALPCMCSVQCAACEATSVCPSADAVVHG